MQTQLVPVRAPPGRARRVALTDCCRMGTGRNENSGENCPCGHCIGLWRCCLTYIRVWTRDRLPWEFWSVATVERAK